MRQEWNQRFDNLVTRDTFLDERRRVDGRFKEQQDDLTELKAAFAAEVQARVQQAAADAQAKVTAAQERDRDNRQRRWLWFAMFATPAAALLVTFVATQLGMRQ